MGRIKMERFSDQQLKGMAEDLEQLSADFKTHIEDERSTYADLIAAQRDNTKAIHDLAAALTAHVHRSDTALEAWESVTGTVRVLGAIGKAAAWLTGIGGLLAGAWYAFTHPPH